MRLTIPLLALCTLAVSCKKDNPSSDQDCEPILTQNHSNDTVFPSDYLMAYPGSWWEYDNGFIDSCTAWEAVPIRTATTEGECVFVSEDQKILPEGLLYATNIAYNQTTFTVGNYNSTICTPLIDTTIGVFHESYRSFANGNQTVSIETLERLTSMTIGSNTYIDVLHVKHADSSYFGHWGMGPSYVHEYWFAKNVGLIKYISNESFLDIELVDHYIAPY